VQFDPNIEELLRASSRDGATVTDLIRLIRQRTQMDKPGEGRLIVSAYLTRTFGIPLDRAAEISGWVGFEDGDGQTSDDELDALLGSYLSAWRR